MTETRKSYVYSATPIWAPEWGMIESDELETRSMTQPYPRAMIGYGRHPLDPK